MAAKKKSKPAKKSAPKAKKAAPKKAAKPAKKAAPPKKAAKPAKKAAAAKKPAPAKKPAVAAKAAAPVAKAAAPVSAAVNKSTPPKSAAPAKRSAAGQVMWHDLMTTDVDKARGFYSSLFPWKTRPVELAPLGVTQRIEAGGAEVGGLVSLPSSEGIASHWMPYVQVKDLDAVVKRAKELGGFAPVPPTPLDNVGRFAVIADPRGAHISPIEVTASMPNRGSLPAPGQVAWNEVLSDDPEGSAKFFADVFGWTLSKSDMGAMGSYTMFKDGDAERAGCMKAPDGVPPMWISYWTVNDVDKSFERAKQLGAQAPMPPFNVPQGRCAMLVDPTGAPFALFQPPKH